MKLLLLVSLSLGLSFMAFAKTLTLTTDEGERGALDTSPHSFLLAENLLAENLLAENQATHSMSDMQANHPMKTMSNSRYLAGGIVSIFIGFGVGHGVQGRYGERGWIFTLTDSITMAGLVVSGVLMVGPKDPTIGLISLAGVGIFGLATRIWAIIDTWNVPSHYKIVKQSRFEVSPLIVSNDSYTSDSSSLSYGLNFKYRF